jgi:hypothetical protein
MATANPADALGWSGRLGRQREGLHTVLVTTDRGPDPSRRSSRSGATSGLVAIHGQPFYGTTGLVRAAGRSTTSRLGLGRLRRWVQLVYPAVPDADMGCVEALADIGGHARFRRLLPQIEHLH